MSDKLSGMAPTWRVLAILSVLLGFASISTDLYLPAMPAIGASLGVGAGKLALTVSSYLAGFSIGQLGWGPIGDRYGRRGPVALGIALFVAGSAGCGLAHSIAALIGWRVVQALGACAGVVLARAMVRDLYQGARAAQVLSGLMMVMAIAPMIGPAIGGQILLYAGWRAIFACLCVIGLCVLVAIATLPESLPPARRNRAPLSAAMGEYGELLRHRRLMGHASVIGFYYFGAFAAIAGTPFAYITYYHLQPQLYGLLFGASVLGIMVANLINTRASPAIGTHRMLRYGAGAAAINGVWVALAAITQWGGLWGLVVPVVLFLAMNGFLVANAIASALAEFPHRAGSASALVGAIQYGGGIAGAGLVGALADGTLHSLGLVIGLSGIGTWGAAVLIRAPASLRTSI